MAEAFCRALKGEYIVSSAGYNVLAEGKEGGVLPKLVLQAMAEKGHNLEMKSRKQLTEKMVTDADIVVSMVKDNIPAYLVSSPKCVYWDVPDPRDQSYEFHCGIRDQIEALIHQSF